jgi:multidrug efflux pump subunit AcrA (membrane-fusion protein)
MSSKMLRIAVVCSVIILAVAIASAQERQKALPAEAQGMDVFNPVEGRIVVLSARPAGARLEKGELICELDPSELRDRAASEELTLSATQAEVQAASLAREVAVMALNQYKDGLFIYELGTATSEIKLAESELASAEDSVDWSTRMFEKGYMSMAAKVAEELGLQKARSALEYAQLKRKVQIDYAKNKKIKELLGAVETARARELRTQAELERKRSAVKRLESQIRRSKVAAPVAGRLRYSSPVGPGAVLRDGQLLCRIVLEGGANPPK